MTFYSLIIESTMDSCDSFKFSLFCQPAIGRDLLAVALTWELFFWYDSGTAINSNNEPLAEVLFVFKRGVTLAFCLGSNFTCQFFARINGDWKYAWIDFANTCSKIRMNGTEPLKNWKGELINCRYKVDLYGLLWLDEFFNPNTEF